MNTELLAPAGSCESMAAAFAAGADAVYIGGRRFGARAYADNPGDEELLWAIDYAHEHGKKLYLTVNTLLKDGELEELYGYLNPLYREGLDAVIVQDWGVFSYVREAFGGLDIHASTQMGITGVHGAKLAKEMGASRVVTARELSLEEIAAIHERVDVEIESFVHGALCVCYSGQCLFSSLIGGRSGNRGRCAQPCRLPYDLLEHGRVLNGKDRYLLSPKDICTLDLLPEILDAGVYSLKIEGRMKSPEYTAGVTRIYRRCLDRLAQRGREGYFVRGEEKKELLDLYNRGGFSTGYYRQHNGPDMMHPERPNHCGTKAAAAGKSGKAGNVLTAVQELHAGDVLECRNPKLEFTLDQNVPAGRKFTVSRKDVRIPPDAVLYRTRSQALQRELRERYVETENLIKINGKLRLLAQKPAILEVSLGSCTARAVGPVPQAARSQALRPEDLESRMRKTGGSGFCFDAFTVETQDGLFLPVSDLNRLRRDALFALRGELRKQYRREGGAEPEVRGVTEDKVFGSVEAEVPGMAESKARGMAEERMPGSVEPEAHGVTEAGTRGKRPGIGMPRENGCTLTVSLEDAGAFEAVCRIEGVHTVCLDCCAFPTRQDFLSQSGKFVRIAHAAGKECVYILPWIFREEALAYYRWEEAGEALQLYDALMLRSQEEYGFLRENGYAGRMAADWNLYTFNRRAARFWRDAGILWDTVPPELNRREIQRRGCRASELLVYGYQPLMATAQCLAKNSMGCKREPRTLYLLDRKQKQFRVKNRCDFCYGVIYNSTPLELYADRDVVLELSPRSIRLQFTCETVSETVETTKDYADAFLGEGRRRRVIREFTRGHFGRGVE